MSPKGHRAAGRPGSEVPFITTIPRRMGRGASDREQKEDCAGRNGRRSPPASWLVLELGFDVREDVADARRQERQSGDERDADQGDDQSVLDQGLALFFTRFFPGHETVDKVEN